MKAPDSSTSSSLARISARNGVYCALTSISGIATRSQCSGSPAAQSPPTDRRDDCQHDRYVEVAKRFVDRLPAASDPVADPDQAERPERRADQRQDGVPDERRLEHTRRDRDE